MSFRKSIVKNWDIIIASTVSVFTSALLFLEMGGIYLWIFSVLFLLFFPGYLITCCYFSSADSISISYRMMMSFVVSIAIIPVSGLALNYIFDLSQDTIISFVLCLTLVLSVAVFITRRFRSGRFYAPIPSISNRFISLDKFDRTVVILSSLVILVCILFILYSIAHPHVDPSSELYITAEDGSITNFPTQLLIGDELVFTAGVVNHEERTINYSLEIWVVQADIVQGEAVISHMWHRGSISIELPSVDKPSSDSHIKQWEQEIVLRFNDTGDYRVWLMLFPEQSGSQFTEGLDYAGSDYELLIQNSLDNEIYNVYLDIQII